MIKNHIIVHFLNGFSKNFIYLIFLFFIINFEKSLSFFPLFKIATPSLISIIIFIFIRKLNMVPSYFILFLVGFINDIIIGSNLGTTTIFILLLKILSEGLLFDNVNKNDQQDWISFTVIFLASFCIVFFMNILLNSSIPDLSPVFYYAGTTLIFFPIINLSINFIFSIKRLLKS